MPPSSNILYADDYDDDQMLIRMALEKAGFPLAIHCVTDGVSAMDYLRGSGEYADRKRFPWPSLLLTDI